MNHRDNHREVQSHYYTYITFSSNVNLFYSLDVQAQAQLRVARL